MLILPPAKTPKEPTPAAKSVADHAPHPSAPRHKDNYVHFEIEDGGTLIECAIYRQALAELRQRYVGGPRELLACFGEFRGRIERIALNKVRSQPGAIGRVTVWSGDLESEATDGKSSSDDT